MPDVAAQPILPADLPRDWTTLRVGSRTLQSAEAATVRYRFERGDAPGAWSIIPDGARAQLLAASPAGPRLEHGLQRFLAQADSHAGHENLRGISLAPDVDALAASRVLDLTRRDPALLNVPSALRPTIARTFRGEAAAMDGVNGAFNEDGMIHTLPDTSRALLASVGAYDPSPSESSGVAPRTWVQFLPNLIRHEVEHSVTPARPGEMDALEEGIAEALRTSLPVAAAARHDLPAAARRYGRVDTASAQATAGWRPHPPVDAERRAAGTTSNQVYVDRRDVVGDLLRLAGIDRHTRAGYAAAREVLQVPAISRVPGALADAVIATHGLDPARREGLRVRIRDLASGQPDGSVEALARDLGIDQ